MRALTKKTVHTANKRQSSSTQVFSALSTKVAHHQSGAFCCFISYLGDDQAPLQLLSDALGAHVLAL